MSKTGTIDLTGAFTKSLVAKLDKAERQRDQLLSAAKAILAPGGGVYGTTDLIAALRAAIAEVEKP